MENGREQPKRFTVYDNRTTFLSITDAIIGNKWAGQSVDSSSARLRYKISAEMAMKNGVFAPLDMLTITDSLFVCVFVRVCV